MKILIVGSGGREHTLTWKLAQSPTVDQIYCAPGNGGIAEIATCVDLSANDLYGLVDFAERESIDLTVIGPEAPLVAGIADLFTARGLPIYGPTQAAARLEGSKSFTRQLLHKHDIDHIQFEVFTDSSAAKAYVRQQGAPIVVKADGLASGKGVEVAQTVAEAEAHIDLCLEQGGYGSAGETVIVEECLVGQECSIKVFTDGETVVPMVPSQDYKPIGDGDVGPNTGGMGCYSPVPVVDSEVFDYIVNQLIRPTIEAMATEGSPYVGTLYAGCILTEQGPKLLEYNCRFGDPETQVVLPRLDGDLFTILQATVEGRLDEVDIHWKQDRCVCVVLASGGYPRSYETGKPISGLAQVAGWEDVMIFHAGTSRQDGQLVTDGGRVLGVTALGKTYRIARERAYQAAAIIDFENKYHRTDIAQRAVEAEHSG